MAQRSRTWTAVVLLFAAAIAVAAIYANTILALQKHNEESHATLGAKDAPFQALAHLDVTFGPTYLQRADGTFVRVGNATAPATLDLARLGGDRWGVVANGTVPAGSYAGVLYTFRSALAIPELAGGIPGASVSVAVPQRGLLVLGNLTFPANGNATAVVDLDLTQSLAGTATSPTLDPVVSQLILGVPGSADAVPVPDPNQGLVTAPAS